jgi:hypothetical protein
MIEPIGEPLEDNKVVTEPTSSREKTDLPINERAKLFRNTLASTLTEESPFKEAPFLTKIAEKYLSAKNKSRYFTTEEGCSANITVENGQAQPNLNLNLQEGLKSKNLQRRIALRLGVEHPTPKDKFCFVVGHELGHLIQGEANYASTEYQDLDGLTETEINQLKLDINNYNKAIRESKEIFEAQQYFLSIFKTDIHRDSNEGYINILNYTEDEYLKYINSTTEANADFISLWIMGMVDHEMKTSPQNEGYKITDWKQWAREHKITTKDIA